MSWLRAAAGDGYRYLVAVGGDGTIHEVANGILQTTSSKETTLGLSVPEREAIFLVHTGISSDYSRVCSTLTNPPVKLLISDR